MPGRHTQTANVENLNRALSRVLNGVMNQEELKTGKQSKNWTHVLPVVIKELNEIRNNKKIPKDIYDYKYPVFDPLTKPPTREQSSLVELRSITSPIKQEPVIKKGRQEKSY
jgi:hypothetical protein